MRFHNIPIRRLQLKPAVIPNATEDVEQLRFSYIAGRTVKQHNYFGKLFCNYLRKLEHTYSPQPVIPFSGIYATLIFMPEDVQERQYHYW